MLQERPGSGRIESRWDDARAENMSQSELLLYRSNLLGSDKRVTNFGGGNTSAKVMERDPISGEEVEVLWVKGSGGDLGSMKRDGFSTLYMDRLNALKGLYKGEDHEDEMVGLQRHATFNLNPRASSIDTALHAFLPYKHVDHVHPDAVIAIAASTNSRELTEKIFGSEIGWLPWKRPGFELSLWLEKFARENPEAKGCVLESHGLFTWADDAKACYELTLDTINRAVAFLDGEIGDTPAFGGQAVAPLAETTRRAVAARLMPKIRGLISGDLKKVGHFEDSPEVLEFVCSNRLDELAALGTSCPDHFLRTKIRPLVVEFDAAGDAEAAAEKALAGLEDAIAAYRDDYAAYYERCRRDNSPAMRDPNPVVYLVPGVGQITFARDKATARIAGEFYINAINVMRGASSVSEYFGLPEQEAFDIEYWLLEEAKLQRMPKPKALAGRVALVTGAAGGIGGATVQTLMEQGACVVLTDVDETALETAINAIDADHGQDPARAAVMDVTSEASVMEAYRAACVEYGGVDIVVSNAGISSSAPLEDTDLSMWQRNMDILSTGYFLVAREAMRLMKQQGIGGAVVFVASKNGLAASPGAAAYCTAKASEIHLARCMALEGAPDGIRVNVVNPDAVLRGSKIWSSEWRAQRAATYNMEPDELEEHYRKRSLLKRSVFPEDIAEAIYFLVSDMSAKSTGNIVNVDAGNAASFTR